MTLSRRTVLSTILPGALSSVVVRRTAHATAPGVRVGILPFGTGAWEFDVTMRHGFAEAQKIAIDLVHYESLSAVQAALQDGRVDVAVLDWLWVVGRRADGADWTFSPISSAAGALVARPDSAIHTVTDLKDTRLGTVDPLDKNWLILQAYAKHKFGIELDQVVKTIFATPPALMQALRVGQLDSMMTIWPFAARAEAHGMRHIIGIEDAVRELGVTGSVPFTGCVFSRSWADNDRAAIDGFIAANRHARALLETSDEEWLRLRPILSTDDDAELDRLKTAYRRGVIHESNETQHASIAQLYRKLAEIGGLAMVGASSEIPSGTFW
jgi:NitT/TauT family transport system substrate-binding protein